MRQIKFRAWHINDKEMLRHNDACLIPLFTPSFRYRDGETVLMQYTDLKDVNGVEIYEGDLVKKDDDKFVRCGVVSFIHGCWMVASKSGERYFNLHWFLSQAEVIGNIHQHPELLEKNNE